MTAVIPFDSRAWLANPRDAQAPVQPDHLAALDTWLAQGNPADAHKAEYETTALAWAVRYTHREVALLLLRQGASPFHEDPNGLTPFDYALKANDDRLWPAMVTLAHPQAAFGWFAAVAADHTASVVRYLELGWPVDTPAPDLLDCSSATALSCARSLEMVALLLRAGAALEAVDAYGESAERRLRAVHPECRELLDRWRHHEDLRAVIETEHKITSLSARREKPRL